MARSDLRGPSADALAALTEQLGPVTGTGATVSRSASTVIGHGDEPARSDLSQVGDDLFAVARHDLRTLVERAAHELAEALLGLLHLPVHVDASVCLDSTD